MSSTTGKSPRDKTKKEVRRDAIEKAGGWYRWHNQQREEHERKTSENRNDRIVTYPQRRYVSKPMKQGVK